MISNSQSTSTSNAAPTILSIERNTSRSPPELYPDSACIRAKVPRVTHFLETAQYFAFTNKSLTRFSEGEFSLMRGISRVFQRADSSLSSALYTVFSSNIPDLEIGIPDVFSGFPYYNPANIRWWNTKVDHRSWVIAHANMTRQYFEAHISSPYMHTDHTHCEFLEKIYTTLRVIWENKDIVLLRGMNNQTYQYDIFNNCRSIVTLFAPSSQAWEKYQELKSSLLKEDPSKLYIISAGPTSRVLVYDLVMAGRRALDLGHLAKDYNRYHLKIHNEDFWTDTGKPY